MERVQEPPVGPSRPDPGPGPRVRECENEDGSFRELVQRLLLDRRRWGIVAPMLASEEQLPATGPGTGVGSGGEP